MLSEEQQIEMTVAMREASRSGEPEKAVKIRAGLIANEYTLGETDEVEIVYIDRPPTHGPGSSLSKWQEYAATASEFDDEVIATTSKKDLILMLEAYDL